MVGSDRLNAPTECPRQDAFSHSSIVVGSSAALTKCPLLYSGVPLQCNTLLAVCTAGGTTAAKKPTRVRCGHRSLVHCVPVLPHGSVEQIACAAGGRGGGKGQEGPRVGRHLCPSNVLDLCTQIVPTGVPGLHDRSGK